MIRRLLPLTLAPLLSFCSTQKDDRREGGSEAQPVTAGLAEARTTRTHQFGVISASCYVSDDTTHIEISNSTSDLIRLDGAIDIYFYDEYSRLKGSASQSITRGIYPYNSIAFQGATPPWDATQCDVDVTDALPRPPAPVDLQFSGIDYNEMNVSWASGGGDTKRFHLIASRTPAYDYSCNGIDVGSAKSYQLTGLTEGVYYYVRVCSENALGIRTSSGEIRVATKAHPAPNPANLALTADGIDRIKAEWQTGGGTTFYYRVQIAQGATAPAEGCPAGVNTDTPKKVFSGLVPNTFYTIRVCASNINDLVTTGVVASVSTQDPEAIHLPFVEEFGGSGRTALGVAWSATGNFAVSAGQVVSDADAGVALLNTQDETRDVRVGIVLNDQPKKAFCSFGLAARARDSANLYAGMIRQQKKKIFADIVRRQDGQNVVLRTIQIKKYHDGSKLEFRAVGDSLQLLVNGKVVLSANDSAFASGQVGLYAIGAGQSADNFYAQSN